MNRPQAYYDLEQCLQFSDGAIQLTIPDGVLPAFLIDAFNQAGSGQTTQARAPLTPEHLRTIEDLMAEHYHGMTVVYLVVGMTYQRLGLLQSAIYGYERLVTLQEHSMVYAELAMLYGQRFCFGQAAVALEKACALAPTASHLRESLPHYWVMSGQPERAVSLLEAEVEQGDIDPHRHSSLLFFHHYLSTINPEQCIAARRQWAQMHTASIYARTDHPRDREPDRALRVGYLSPDFRQHSVAYAFEATLDSPRPERVTSIGYGSVQHPDTVTERLRGKFDLYRDIWGMADAAVADLIEADQIDILVTLAGHSSAHRLGVLAYKPAPILVDNGALATLGLSQVDFRITDIWLDPPSQQCRYEAQFVYLPNGYYCYQPLEQSPTVTPAPLLQQGHVTFGSFNNLAKINDSTLSLWSQVIQTVPESRLVLKFPGSHDPLLRDRLLERLRQVGVLKHRVTILDYCHTHAEHLACYHQVDIMLDTFPFQGSITTLESLWMGVPVIALAGDTLVAHVAQSILTPVGLDFFVAHDACTYVARAATLASKPAALSKLRSTLRNRMRQSPLCDSQRYGRELEAAYRTMWHRYLNRTHAPGVVTSTGGNSAPSLPEVGIHGSH